MDYTLYNAMILYYTMLNCSGLYTLYDAMIVGYFILYRTGWFFNDSRYDLYLNVL